MGLIKPIDALTINGHEITPFGFSLVPFLILGGLVVPRLLRPLGGAPRPARARARCSTATCCSIKPLRAGLSTLLRAAADPDGYVLRPPGLPPGRARLRRVRDRASGSSRCRSRCCSRRSPGRSWRGGSPRRGRPGRPRLRWRSRRSSSSATIDVEAERDGVRGVARLLRRSGPGCSMSQLGNVIMSSVDRPRRRTRPAACRAPRRTSARRSARR